MILEVAAVVALSKQCAPSVAVETLVSVVHTESRFNPYAIGVNSEGVSAPKPMDKATAVASARSLIARGYNIDLGLGQINSANLEWLGLSVEDTFDPCRNLAAAARVLSTNYLSVARSSRSTEDALATAMSLYNTGNRTRGFSNGYVGRVYASAQAVIPRIRGGSASGAAAQPVPPAAPVAAPAPRDPVGWDTTAGAQSASLMVFGGTSKNALKGTFE